MRALLEEIISAEAVSEIVELPWLGTGPATTDHFLVHEDFNRPKVPLEITGISIGLSQLRWGNIRIVLRRCWCAVTQPFLQFEERQWFFGVEQLRSNRRATTMAGDVTPNIGRRYSGLAAEPRNKDVV